MPRMPTSTARGGAALVRCPSSRTATIFTRRIPQERSLFARPASNGSALRHSDVVLVERQLPAVDPDAEAEVAGKDKEEACEDAAYDGADVGARRTLLAGLRGGGGGACFGDDGAVGARDGVGGLDGVGDCFASRKRAGGSGRNRSGEGCTTGGAAANDGLDGARNLVAVGARKAL